MDVIESVLINSMRLSEQGLTEFDGLGTMPLPDAESVVSESSTPPDALLLLKRNDGILVTGDSLQNTLAADEFANLPAKLMMKKMGFYHWPRN